MNRTNMAEFAAQLLKQYGDILSRDGLEAVPSKGLIGRRIRLLKEMSSGLESYGGLDRAHQESFADAVFDGAILAFATGQNRDVFSLPAIGDSKLLGTMAQCRSALTSNNEAVKDWFFSKSVQAAAALQGQHRLVDLQLDERVQSRFIGKPICDYALPDINEPRELLECKRLHPAGLLDTSKLAKKVTRNALRKGYSQLVQTRKHLDTPNAALQLVIDISAYGADAAKQSVGDLKIESKSLSPSIVEELKAKLRGTCKIFPELDQVCLCWRERHVINGDVAAIIQKTDVIALTDRDGMSRLPGFTVRTYLSNEIDVQLICISSEVEDLASIIGMYNNLWKPSEYWKHEWVSPQ